jgi:HD-GYP domain-containing protein (c-di-GMP phosphodiesterase class II)
MVKPVGGILSHIADAIEMHHEKYDGSGYRGLKGEEIPLAARIVAAADVFDALLSDRPYRKGMAIREAMDHIVGSAGTHFDPQVVAALSTVVNRDGEQALAEVLRDAEYISPTGLAR